MLSGQKSKLLKFLCLHQGLQTTGTKSTLCERLDHGLHIPKPRQILAIDVGIKNFSYCQFQANYNLEDKAGHKVEHWSKLDLTENLHDFTPVSLAEVAYSTMKDITLSNKTIDLIVIEQQRSRSGGASAVLEWTLRVNMLENMLYSTIYTIKKETSSFKNTIVVSSNPRKMSDYWLNYKPLFQDQLQKPTKKPGKKDRIYLVEKLIDSNIVEIAINTNNKKDRSQTLFSRYVDKEGHKRFSKSDDLADSFLHGFTWLRWLDNRAKMESCLKSGGDIVELCEVIESSHLGLII